MRRIHGSAAILGVGLILASSSASAQNSAFGSRDIGSSVGALDRTSAFGTGTSGAGTIGTADSGNVIQRNVATGSLRDLLNSGGLNTFGGGGLSQFGTFGTTGLGFSQSFGFGRNTFGAQPGQTGQATGETQMRGDLRLRVVLGFSMPPLADPVINERLTKRLNNTGRIENLGALEVSIANRTVTLKGTVATDHARQLAERLVMLEPGVSAVNNQLNVATADSRGSSADTGPELLPIPVP